MRGRGLLWLGLVALGPAIWAAAFTLVYALHGAGCAAGWAGLDIGPVSLHRLLMLLGWLAGIAAGGWLLLRLPAGKDRETWLPRAGALIGLFATLFTLVPVLFASSC